MTQPITPIARHPQFMRRPGPTRTLLLDLDRAGSYEPRILAVPKASDVDIAARSTYEEQLNIEPGSWLWALSGSSDETAGFKAQITDMQTGANLASKPINYRNCTGQGSASGVTNPLHILSRPRLILEPGLVAVQIINLATVQNKIQLCLWSAVPFDPEARPVILSGEERAAQIDALERLHRLHDITRARYPAEAAARRVVGITAAGAGATPPWEAMPATGKAFHHEQVVDTPAVGTSDYAVVAVTVPYGWTMAIKDIHCRYMGSGFQDGSGDLIWRLSVDDAFQPGYDDIRTSLGSAGQPYSLGSAAILAYSNQLVKFTVSVDAGTGIPTGSAAQLLCMIGGWYYPESLAA